MTDLNENINESNLDEIDLVRFINAFKRNILLFLLISFSTSSFLTLIIPSSYKANYELLINNKINEYMQLLNLDYGFEKFITSQLKDPRIYEPIYRKIRFNPETGKGNQDPVEWFNENIKIKISSSPISINVTHIGKNERQVKELTNLVLKTQISEINQLVRKSNEVYIKKIKLDYQGKLLNRNADISYSEKLENIFLGLSDEKDVIIRRPIKITNVEKFKFSEKLFIFSILSLITSFIIITIKEKSSNIVYEFKDLEKSIKANYLGNITLKDKTYSQKLIKHTLQERDIKGKIKVIQLDSLSLKKNETFDNYLKEIFISSINVNIIKDEHKNENDQFLIVASKNLVKYNDLKLFNQYICFVKGKVIGWYYLT
ncbi:hypothetical protein OA320_01400 [Prochlorococcus sp. AH-716-O10]|nr:hypothetical protein [Prochlorococcus sp. AH-716-O10]